MSRTARSILLWPFHLGALFSQAKSFRDNPILGSRTLNRLGLHVARVALAHAIVGLRRRVFLFWLVDAETRRAFARDGYVEIRNFVPPERLAALRAEIQACRVETRAMQQGDTATVTVLLDDTALADLPACRELLDSPAFFNPLAYVGARWKHALAFIHVVKNANASGARDPQKTFHSDTFHSTMKAWLFLEDVAEEEGPFNYVPGSHRLTRKRLAWEHRQAVTGADLPDRLSQRGSLRATEEDLREMGCREPIRFAVPANTLVIADTNGFHRRGHSPKPSHRVAIYASSRSNPFNPWPGLPLRAWRRLEHWVRDWEYRRDDAKAAARGGRPIWRKVEPSRLRRDVG